MLYSEKLQLINMLIRDEGFNRFPYKDIFGNITIGYGRNLTYVGINEQESEYLLTMDIAICETQLFNSIKNFGLLSINRRIVLINMVYNIGIHKFLSFVKLINHIENNEFDKASDEMLNSKWALQVGNRAIRLAKYMKDDFIE